MSATAARTDSFLPPPLLMRGLTLGGPIAAADRASRVRDTLLRLAADPNLTLRGTIAAIAAAAASCDVSPGAMSRFVAPLPRSTIILRSHLAERASAAHSFFAPAVRRSFDPAEVAALLGLAAADEDIATEVLAGAVLVRGRIVAVLRPGGAGFGALWTVTRIAVPPEARGAEAAAAFREMREWAFRNLPISMLGAHVPAENRPACRMAVAAGFTLHTTTPGFRHYSRKR